MNYAGSRILSILLAIAYLAQGTLIHADPVISFFLRDYPTSNQACALELSEKLKKPNCLAKRSLEGVMPQHRVAGIMATYFGFLQVSSLNGQMVFPRKQSKNSLNVIIANKITPIILSHNTISHWELEPGAAAAAYDFEFKQDPTTNLTFWEVKTGSVPENRQIHPIDTLIIIAKPSAIYIPLGVTPAPRDANLLLPDMYVKKSIDPTADALYMLNIAHYFRPIDLLYKKEPKLYETIIQE